MLLNFLFHVSWSLILGIAEVGVMIVSTSLVTLVMLLIWQTNLLLALCFPLVFGTIEFVYLCAVLSKIREGGWIPLAFATCFLCVMYTWNYGTVLKYKNEVRQTISSDTILELGPTLGTTRVPGIGLLYNELVNGVPSIFGQFLLNLPAIHSTIVFVCIKYVPVPIVPQEERFLFRRVCPKDYHLFRCIARYGYKDVRKEDHRLFERLLAESLEKFLRKESDEYALEDSAETAEVLRPRNERFAIEDGCDELRVPLMESEVVEESRAPRWSAAAGDEFERASLREAMEKGFTYLLGDGDVRARKESWFFKKLVINYFYSFLRRNCRGGAANMRVPHMDIIEVGITYMV